MSEYLVHLTVFVYLSLERKRPRLFMKLADRKGKKGNKCRHQEYTRKGTFRHVEKNVCKHET